MLTLFKCYYLEDRAYSWREYKPLEDSLGWFGISLSRSLRWNNRDDCLEVTAWDPKVLFLSWIIHSKSQSWFITARQQSCGNVMFSVVCVCQSLCPRGVGGPMWPLPMIHWPSLFRDPPAMGLQSTGDPLALHQTWDYPHPPGMGP